MDPDKTTIDIVLIGDAGVGKTCIINRFADDSYVRTHVSTVGVDFKVKTIKLGAKQIKLQIWDTAGMEKFNTLTSSWYRRASGVMLCYDMTERPTFDRLRRWLELVKENCSPDVCLMLIGNKRDQTSQRHVSQMAAEHLAADVDAVFIETSAEENVNIEKAFHDLAQSIMEKREKAAKAPNRQLSTRSDTSFRLVFHDGHESLDASLNAKSLTLMHEERRLVELEREHKEYLKQHSSKLNDYDVQHAECKRRIKMLEQNMKDIRSGSLTSPKGSKRSKKCCKTS